MCARREHLTPRTWLDFSPFRGERGHQSDWQFFLQNHQQTQREGSSSFNSEGGQKKAPNPAIHKRIFGVVHFNNKLLAGISYEARRAVCPAPSPILKMKQVFRLFTPGGLLPSQVAIHSKWTSVWDVSAFAHDEISHQENKAGTSRS